MGPSMAPACLQARPSRQQRRRRPPNPVACALWQVVCILGVCEIVESQQQCAMASDGEEQDMRAGLGQPQRPRARVRMICEWP